MFKEAEIRLNQAYYWLILALNSSVHLNNKVGKLAKQT
jgi:hypothetical protein